MESNYFVDFGFVGDENDDEQRDDCCEDASIDEFNVNDSDNNNDNILRSNSNDVNSGGTNGNGISRSNTAANCNVNSLRINNGIDVDTNNDIGATTSSTPPGKLKRSLAQQTNLSWRTRGASTLKRFKAAADLTSDEGRSGSLTHEKQTATSIKTPPTRSGFRSNLIYSCHSGVSNQNSFSRSQSFGGKKQAVKTLVDSHHHHHNHRLINGRNHDNGGHSCEGRPLDVLNCGTPRKGIPSLQELKFNEIPALARTGLKAFLRFIDDSESSKTTTTTTTAATAAATFDNRKHLHPIRDHRLNNHHHHHHRRGRHHDPPLGSRAFQGSSTPRGQNVVPLFDLDTNDFRLIQDRIQSRTGTNGRLGNGKTDGEHHHHHHHQQRDFVMRPWSSESSNTFGGCNRCEDTMGIPRGCSGARLPDERTSTLHGNVTAEYKSYSLLSPLQKFQRILRDIEELELLVRNQMIGQDRLGNQKLLNHLEMYAECSSREVLQGLPAHARKPDRKYSNNKIESVNWKTSNKHRPEFPDSKRNGKHPKPGQVDVTSSSHSSSPHRHSPPPPPPLPLLLRLLLLIK